MKIPQSPSSGKWKHKTPSCFSFISIKIYAPVSPCRRIVWLHSSGHSLIFQRIPRAEIASLLKRIFNRVLASPVQRKQYGTSHLQWPSCESDKYLRCNRGHAINNSRTDHGYGRGIKYFISAWKYLIANSIQTIDIDRF